MSKNSIQKNTKEILTLSVPAGFAVAAVVSMKTESFTLGGIVGAVVAGIIICLAMIYKTSAINKLESGNVKEKKNKPDGASIQVCSRCGSKLVLKDGKRGKFYGCSAFPQCRFSKDI